MRRLLAFLILAFLFAASLSPAASGAETRKQHIISFAASCIDNRGGAVLHPGVTVPTVSATYATAGVLQTLSAWTAADDLLTESDLLANMTKWVKDLQNTTKPTNNTNYGGFVERTGAKIATLRYTHEALAALAWPNRTTSINATLATNFTIALQRVNATEFPTTVGGFADRYNESATVAATYYALEALVVLGQLSRINSTLAIAWLNSSQVLGPSNGTSYGGFLNGRNATYATLQSTYMAVRSLEILGALSSINQSAAIAFALSCYHSDPDYPQYQGGFGQTQDDFVSIQSATYYAVATLRILGADSQLHADVVSAWVLGKQCADGGFADTSSASGLAPQTYFAVATLALLNKLDSLNEVTEPEPYIFPLWIVGLTALIAVLVVCVVVARRRKWF